MSEYETSAARSAVSLSAEQAGKSINLLRHVIGMDNKLDRNDYCRCPFHEEKSASLHLFVAKSGKARYHCFGCEQQGDIFDYLRQKHNLPFRAALVYLSDLTNRQPHFLLPGQPGSTDALIVDGPVRECSSCGAFDWFVKFVIANELLIEAANIMGKYAHGRQEDMDQSIARKFVLNHIELYPEFVAKVEEKL